MSTPFSWLSSPIFPILCLFGVGILTSFYSSSLILGRFQAKDYLKKREKSFFFHSLFIRFFPKNQWENLSLILSFTKQILLVLYATFAFFYTLFTLSSGKLSEHIFSLFFIALLLVLVSIVIDIVFRSFANAFPYALLSLSTPFTSFFLTLFFPITAPLIKLSYLHSNYKKEKEPSLQGKDRIKEMLNESEIGQYLDPYEHKLITSVISFQKRVVKEIMIPRIDMVSLPINTPLSEAASLFMKERYSRIPLYKETVDKIEGVLLYKDLLQYLLEKETLSTSAEVLAKPVIYAPENKKISQLLAEFRSQKLHLAIVVDEYGGTEGIVTIEDILEELVGEIEDEYDLEKDELFWKLPSGSWVVDAKMSIIDIENKLGIHIPEHPEYETIGGYIFHRAGKIPLQGWTIHHDDFDLEILTSSDRAIEKIRITPRRREEEISI